MLELLRARCDGDRWRGRGRWRCRAHAGDLRFDLLHCHQPHFVSQAFAYRRLLKHGGMWGGLLRIISLSAGAWLHRLFQLLLSLLLLLLSYLLLAIVSHHHFHLLTPCAVCLDLCSAGPPPPPLSIPCEYGESWCNSCHTSLGSSSGSFTTGSSPHDPFPALAPCAT